MEATLADRVALWSTRETADRLRLRHGTLANRRSKGLGPRFVKVGRRVAYRVLDVEEWLNAQTRTSSRPGSASRPTVDDPASSSACGRVA